MSFALSFKMNFPSGKHSPKARDRQLAAHSLPVPEPAPTSLELKRSESGPGVGCGWLSKLGNVLVITFYCCLHFDSQISPPPSPSLCFSTQFLPHSDCQFNPGSLPPEIFDLVQELGINFSPLTSPDQDNQHQPAALPDCRLCLLSSAWYNSSPFFLNMELATSYQLPGDLVQHFTSRWCYQACELSQFAPLIRKKCRRTVTSLVCIALL